LGTQRDLSGSQPTGGAIYPDVDVDAAGNAVAVWSHCRTPCNDIAGGPFDVEGASRLAAADTWAPFAPFGTGPAPYGNLDPQVAVDKAGNAVAVWIAPNRSVQSASRAAGGGFGTPQTGISAPFAEGIRLAMDSQGNAMALWVRRDGAGGSGFLGACPCRIEAAAKPVGGVFGTVQTISPDLDSHAASLGVDGQGNAIKSAKGGKVNLVKLFNRKKKGSKKKIAKLQVNTKVEIKITEPNAIGSFSVFTIRGGKNPSRVNGCLAANTNLKTACPKS
jgi:hypothetical protein